MNTRAVGKGIRSSLMGVAVNASLALFKGAAGYFGNCYALIADAIESGSDVFSSLIVAAGLKVATIPRDENHPYGHGKAEPIAAIIVSCMLMLAAVTIAVQSIREIRSPHTTPAPFTLLVLVVVIVVKETLFRYVFDVGTETSSTAVKTDAWHHRSDAITSAAAFVGISVALWAGKGYEDADDWAALFASGIIVFNAVRMLRPAVAEVMDIAPSPEFTEAVKMIAQAVPGVMTVEKCLLRKMGFDYYVDLHIWVNGDISVSEGHRIASDVREMIKQKQQRVADVLIHIEPYRKQSGDKA
ncbi:MAG: cation diffusion facilitator family transporter [Armatimonadota bacterium]